MAPGILRDPYEAPKIPVFNEYEYKSSTFSDEGTSRGEGPSPEPIAIVGMGCRLPGDVSTPSKLWDLLIDKRATKTRVPASRFNIEGFIHPNVQRPGSIVPDGGNFIDEDIRSFDNTFFGIHNLEASYMDPEQRKLLEVVFECFESAGTTLEQVSGANAGCYVGKFTYDYLNVQNKDPEYLHRYSATGMSTSIIANRVSHVFNLLGPSVVLDTACSSSLYCLHMACTALEANDCESAIVAGVNLIQSPEQHMATMKAGVLSPTSTCHTFDISADGYGRGEAVGALYLKKLSKAVQDKDPIRSVIRGTAVNSNGKTPGVTLPSAAGQEAVIRKAYAKANLPLDQTTWVECHGTGTAVGDPIEVEALARVFRPSADRPLLIGSVKPNLGHSEAASAISSIIKVTLALEKGEIPATIGVTTVNPKIQCDEWNVRIVTANTAWPSCAPVRRASVNSFGFGGANAHVVLEAAATHVVFGCSPLLTSASFLLPFSANNHSSLQSRIQDLSSSSLRDTNVVDLAYTLGLRRSHLNVRGFLIAAQQDIEDDVQVEKLQTAVGPQVYSRQPVVFVFTGQGAQWPQMGKELLERCPSFRHSIRHLDTVLQMLPDSPSWTIQEILIEPSETSKINQASYAQPVCTAIQIAIVQLLAQWGIVPQQVIGHSSGEICAAYAAGQLSAEQAIVVAYYRGYACSKSLSHGMMLAIGISDHEAELIIEALGLGDSVRVACINSPESVTLSGDSEAIRQMRLHFSKMRVFAQELKTDGKAYHSHHMALVAQEYQKLLVAALPLLPDPDQTSPIPRWVSTVTGDFIISRLDPNYWCLNLESTVRFSSAIRRIIDRSGVHFIEIGPHPVLELPIKQTLSKLTRNVSKVYYSRTLSRGQSGVRSMLSLMGDLYLHFHNVPFELVNRGNDSQSNAKRLENQGKVLINLPKYRWKYETTLWNESRASEEFRFRRYPRHDLVGSQIPGGSGTIKTWRNVLRVKDVHWLKHHKIDGVVVFPAAGYIAMAIEVFCQVTNSDLLHLPPCYLHHINVSKALVLSNEDSDQGVELFTILSPVEASLDTSSSQSRRFSISSCSNGVTTIHAKGTIGLDCSTLPLIHGNSFKSEDTEPASVRSWYDRLSKAGLNFSGPFRSLTEIRNRKSGAGGHTIAKTRLFRWDSTISESIYALHPVTIDAILHTALIATAAGSLKDFQLRIPTTIESFRIRVPASCYIDESLIVYGSAEPTGVESMRSSSEVCNEQHETFIQVQNCRLVVPFQNQQATVQERHPMLRITWKPDVTTVFGANQEPFANCLQRADVTGFPRTEDFYLHRIIGALDLIVHKYLQLRILEIGENESGLTYSLLDCLQFNSGFRRCQSYAKCNIDKHTELLIEYVKSASSTSFAFIQGDALEKYSFDLLISPEMHCERQDLERAKKCLSPNGMILGRCSHSQINDLAGNGFSIVCLASGEELSSVVLAYRSERRAQLSNTNTKRLILVEPDSKHPLSDMLEAELSDHYAQPVRRVGLNDVSSATIPSGSTIVSIIELEKAFLSTASSEDFGRLKTLTDNASILLWITGGNLITGARPDFAIASGLSRAIMLEQPALKFLTVDIDDPSIMLEKTVHNLLAVLKQSVDDSTPDFEYVQVRGALYISRFAPAHLLNSTFRQKQGFEITSMFLHDGLPCKLSLERSQQLNTAHFTQSAQNSESLEPDAVEVNVKSVGLDSEVIDILLGKIDTDCGTLTSEYSGLVTRVGSDVSSVGIGDRVAVTAPGHFATNERAPDWACLKLQDDETYGAASTRLLACSTAIYALHCRARICAGESILIYSGAINLAVVAVQIAQLANADVFSTAWTKDEEEFLIAALGMRRDHILDPKSPSFLSNVLTVTMQRGFDVVLSHSSQIVPKEIWEACADFGRFVEIDRGDRGDEEDAMTLCSGFSRRNRSLIKFKMRDLFSLTNQARQRTWAGLLANSMSLYREHKIRSVLPFKQFDVADVTQAFEYLQSSSGIGSVAINFENPLSSIKIIPRKYDTAFSSRKTYFMVGCLGGLGRSMASWMLTRGARRFMFMGRTGLKSKIAQTFVEGLRKKGAEVEVQQGDVCDYSDVTSVINQIQGPIGGIVQAAMTLDESLFASMSHDKWQNVLKPKVLGTWNIHKALEGRNDGLDFFLMTSSISGSIGVATESNYCASNLFLDTFARFRRNAGLPATSIGLGMISQVGYLHEHPDIENGLVHKGVQAIDEEEFLQIVDIALSSRPANDSKFDYDGLSSSHILTGLETLGLTELRRRGFEGTPATFNDPRASLLNAAMVRDSSEQPTTLGNGMPAGTVETIIAGELVNETVLRLISKQLSNFLLTPVDKLDTTRPLSNFGMDSMLAAAVRAWFYRTFEVDVPFMTLLSQTNSIRDLAEDITQELVKRQGRNEPDIKA